MLGREERFVLCTLGVVLLCLHTFVVVRTSPMGRQTSSTLLRNLKKNLTQLSKAFNLTSQGNTNSGDKYTTGGYRDVGAAKSNEKIKIDMSLIRATSTNVRKGKLHSKYGFFVQMSNDGFVDGTVDDKSANVLFEFQSVQVGVMRIKNIASGRYLAMDKHGNLRGRLRLSLETLFNETQGENEFHCYTSYKYKSWYLGIRKNGTPKPGRRTAPHQNAVQFLPLYSD